MYHVLNRANGRQGLFDDDGDYAAFERALGQACERGHVIGGSIHVRPMTRVVFSIVGA